MNAPQATPTLPDAQTVIEVQHYTGRLFSFKVTRPRTLRFRSGEFVMIGLLKEDGKPLLRAYSIASPAWDDELEFYSIKVQDVMSTDITTIAQEMPFRKILETISYSKNFYFPVLDNRGDMTGILSFSDIREVIFEEQLGDLLVAGELANTKVYSLTPQQNLSDAMEIFSQLDVDQLPVVRSEDKLKVIGMITRGDMMASYNRAILVSGFDK